MPDAKIILGTVSSGGFSVLGWLIENTPTLQVISLLVGILVGLVTLAYTIWKWVKGR